MWQRIDNPIAPKRRTTPAVARRSNQNHAYLVLPAEMVTGPRAEVFTAPDGRIGFLFGQKGQFSVTADHPRAKSRRVTVPAQVKLPVPVGLTEITLERIDGMLVLDPSTLRVGAMQ